jgi:lysine 2,3-aminomutase
VRKVKVMRTTGVTEQADITGKTEKIAALSKAPQIQRGAGEVLRKILLADGSRLTEDKDIYLKILWDANSEIHAILQQAGDLEQARNGLYTYTELVERAIFSRGSKLHVLEKATIRECVRVMRQIIAPSNEEVAGFSALCHLWGLARGESGVAETVSNGFLLEFVYLFRGIAGLSNIYDEKTDVLGEIPEFLMLEGREAAIRRTEILDAMAGAMDRFLNRYPSGLNQRVIERRLENKARIIEAIGGSEADWSDYRWHLKNVIKTPDVLIDILDLGNDETAAVKKAIANRIPFGITPYYLSLMDRNRELGYDAVIRAQVIPPDDYVDQLAVHRDERRAVFDYMGEQDTSPVDLITRRYPRVAILKPYNTCSQICVYCQRNWEIDECLSADAMASEERISRAMSWLKQHPTVNEVLVTGGDPMVMEDTKISSLFDHLASLHQIRRIRIGTRTPVVLPQRWTSSLVDLVGRYHEPGKREVAVVTHFEHPYEVTPDAMETVSRIRARGIGVYNQQVFTVWNSRRFESAKLRIVLRSIGVDPYYTFNMKGKEETESYVAPIARLQQERKEEARLLPGLDRTDEPVFNLPRLGKNYLRMWQDHRLLSIRPDGRRVYSFHPWEKNITLVPPYIFVDVSIFEYLQSLAARGEELREYSTIWYYF